VLVLKPKLVERIHEIAQQGNLISKVIVLSSFIIINIILNPTIEFD
jgi:hypothetical protein